MSSVKTLETVFSLIYLLQELKALGRIRLEIKTMTDGIKHDENIWIVQIQRLLSGLVYYSERVIKTMMQ